MPPMLYGSTVDSLAQGQRDYDALYGNANHANADALTQARNNQIQLTLGAQDRARQADDLNRKYDWEATQKALDRQSHLADVTAQYYLDNKLRDRTTVEQDFKGASRDASIGVLPADKNRLKGMYPSFNDAQINQLFNVAGETAVAKVQQAADFATKNLMPPDRSVIDTSGVPKGTAFESRAHDIISAARAPYETLYNKSADDANTGTRLAAIEKDQTALAKNPTPVRDAWYNPMGVFGSWKNDVPQSAVVQPGAGMPSPEDVSKRFSDYKTAIGGKDSMVVQNLTGPGYVSNVPPSWAPLMGGQTATAPAAPAPVAVAAPPASPFKTSDDVSAAYKAGKLDRQSAKQILLQQFGIK